MQKNQRKKTVPKRTRRRVVKKPSLLARSLRYLPSLLILAAAFSIHSVPASGAPKFLSNNSVLSYATSMSTGELLSQTNNQRSQNGVGGLNLNSKLNSAAQSKANDMVARDYWSHVTPTGEQPWVFIAAAGYSYVTAGENLAYGFDNAADTVTGWMNSPPHRENLLNAAFKDVGFGFANSTNFVDTGEQTIIVAMYGAPTNQPAPAPVAAATPAPPAPSPQAKPSATNQPAPVTEPIQTTVEPAPVETLVETPISTPEEAKKAEVKDTPVASTVQLRRIQLLTGGNARWSSTLLVLSLCAMGILWAIQRGLEIKRLLRAGERFLLHNLHIDMTVMAFLVLGATLLQNTGTIR